MQVKLGCKLTFIVLSMCLLVGCVSNEDPYKHMNEEQIFASGQMALRRQHFNTAIVDFEAKDPYGAYADRQLQRQHVTEPFLLANPGDRNNRDVFGNNKRDANFAGESG